MSDDRRPVITSRPASTSSSLRLVTFMATLPLVQRALGPGVPARTKRRETSRRANRPCSTIRPAADTQPVESPLGGAAGEREPTALDPKEPGGRDASGLHISTGQSG